MCGAAQQRMFKGPGAGTPFLCFLHRRKASEEVWGRQGWVGSGQVMEGGQGLKFKFYSKCKEKPLGVL